MAIDRLVTLVKDYFRYLDMPKGWGFGAEKKKAENALRRFIRDYKPTQVKQLVIRKPKGG